MSKNRDFLDGRIGSDSGAGRVTGHPTPTSHPRKGSSIQGGPRTSKSEKHRVAAEIPRLKTNNANCPKVFGVFNNHCLTPSSK